MHDARCLLDSCSTHRLNLLSCKIIVAKRSSSSVLRTPVHAHVACKGYYLSWVQLMLQHMGLIQ